MSSSYFKVLLIEDNPADAYIVKDYLNQAAGSKFELVHRDRFGAGLSYLAKENVDVILLDLKLPDSAGLENVTKIQKQVPRTPVIVLSGTLQELAEAVQGVKVGAQDYLVKNDLRASLLERSIRYAIERKQFDLMKDDFVNFVSHELRNPLTTIKGSLDNLAQNIAGPLNKDQVECVEMANRSIARLIRMANAILELVRLESGRAKITPEKTNLAALVQETVASFNNEATKKTISIMANWPSSLPEVPVDGDLMRQVFRNLIENALRFARTQIVIQGKLLAPSGGVEVVVSDDGPGISPEQGSKIFEKFEQIKRYQNQNVYKGTGLGLAICKGIVDLHGGQIWLDSKDGQGAEFHFSIPPSRQ